MFLIRVIFSENWLLQNMHQEHHQLQHRQDGVVMGDSDALVGSLSMVVGLL
jgi:hypothetical protein